VLEEFVSVSRKFRHLNEAIAISNEPDDVRATASVLRWTLHLSGAMLMKQSQLTLIRPFLYRV